MESQVIRSGIIRASITLMLQMVLLWTFQPFFFRSRQFLALFLDKNPFIAEKLLQKESKVFL